MSRLARVLAGIWLALALLGAALAIRLLLFCATEHHPDAFPAVAAAGMLAIAIVVAWAIPLGVSSAGILAAKRWGLSSLALHCGLGALLWTCTSVVFLPQTMKAIENRRIHGPNWGGYPENLQISLAMLGVLLFSAFSAFVLIREAMPSDAAGRPPGTRAPRPHINPRAVRLALLVGAGLVLCCGAHLVVRRSLATRELREAMRTGTLMWVETAIRHGADANARDAEGRTMLMVAAMEDYPEACSALLANGAAIDARDREGNTALHWASTKRGRWTVNILLRAGIDEDARNNRGLVAAAVARARKDYAVVNAINYHRAGRLYGH